MKRAPFSGFVGHLLREIRESFQEDVFSQLPPVNLIGPSVESEKCLENGVLHPQDLQCLSQAVKDNKQPELLEINLMHTPLHGHLKKLLGGADHPGFPMLRWLGLMHTCVNQEDLRSLGEVVRMQQLPQLQTLLLSENWLNGRLRCLLGDAGHPGFSCLETLSLEATNLRLKDLQALAEAATQNKLPKLKVLELARNPFSRCLKQLFGGKNHPGFPALEYLDLSHTHLHPEEDVAKYPIGGEPFFRLETLACEKQSSCR